MDDEPDILGAAKMILEGEAYQVSTGSTGEEALQKADAEIPDLVLLDVVLPGKSGLEVCKLLKTQAKTRHIPVVIFTVLGRDVDKRLSGEAGADGHFTKPFTPEDLSSEVKRQLEKARGSKFSKQLGLEHIQLKGKKLLLEFDPSTPYEGLVRDFALESAHHNEEVIVLTKKGGTVRQALEGEKSAEIIDLTPDLMLSSILERHREGSLSLVYDSLTDLALSADSQSAYRFTQNSLRLLSDPRITAIFLLNPSAHEPREVSSLRGLFSNQVAYGKQGTTTVRIA